VTRDWERFVVEQEIARGGMGVVFRARDEQSGAPVALKLLMPVERADEQMLERFSREARTLAELLHPGIVRYVAHGQWSDGRPFLAMEWLDGESLSRRLQRGGLRIGESLSLARQVADALAVAHRRGVVHRDLKPSNLFLRHGDVSQAVVLDFGLARKTFDGTTLTGAGRLVGTPEYMAPEQMRGELKLPLSVDVFALGCVLFECLTGQRPFTADRIETLLAKVLLEEAPRLRSARPSLPATLDTLVARMLERQASLRPRDGDTLRDELDALGPLDGEPPASALTRDLPPHVGEVHLVTVLACAQPDHATDETVADGDFNHRELLQAELARLGARVTWLRDGTILGAILRGGHARDQAALAARCASVLLARVPDGRVAITTGHGTLDPAGRTPTGEAAERALALCHGDATLSVSGALRLDSLTAGLLDGRFLVERATPDVWTLVGERSPLDEARPLLGQPTPFVGRERELATLELALDECREDSVARAVLVVAPPGTGKSRLCTELRRRLGSRTDPPQLLLGRAEVMGAGSPYGPLAQALLGAGDAAALGDGQRAEKLRERVTRRLPQESAPRVAAFLSEMCGIHVDDGADPLLGAARAEPRILSEQIARAFIEWLRAECGAGPVVLVLEDLHWSDALTVRLCDLALRELAERPLLVLGVARPEIETQFPKLWLERGALVMRLAGLSGQAGERLIRRALGERATPELLSRLVQKAAGNALYLEELVRAVAAGQGDTLPETLMAMLEARFAHLPPRARQLLRPASVFGEAFWPDGIDGVAEPAETLDELCRSEVIERRAERRFAAHEEYRFRHALMREAAYNLMREPEKLAAHARAARFLVDAGEADAMVLAEHHRLAGEPAQAVGFYVRAARQSFDNNDSDAAAARVAHAFACQPTGDDLAELSAMEALLAHWKGEWPKAIECGRKALALLAQGTVTWCRVVRVLFSVAGMSNDRELLGELMSRYRTASPEPNAIGRYVEAGAVLPIMFSVRGLRREARGSLDRMLLVGGGASLDASARAFLEHSHAWVSYLLEPAPHAAMVHAREAARGFDLIVDWRNAVLVKALLGLALAELSQLAEGEAAGREAVALAQRLGETHARSHALVHLAYLLATRTGSRAVDEARALAEEALAIGGLNPVYRTRALAACSRAALQMGRAAEAAARAGEALAVPGAPITMLLLAHHAEVAALTAAGRADEAHARALVAERALSDFGCAGNTEVALRVACAEAHFAAGQKEAARAALAAAQACIDERARDFPDPVERRAFVEGIDENARAAALAAAWA
jgi:hypothetical protein